MPGINNVMIDAVRALCGNAPSVHTGVPMSVLITKASDQPREGFGLLMHVARTGPGTNILDLRCACAVPKVGCFPPPVTPGTQGPEFCTPDAVLNGSASVGGGGLQGCSRDEHRHHWRCARAVRTPPPPEARTCMCRALLE